MEILVVAVIALIVFGPRRLPEIARSVGKAFSEFRRQANEVRDEFESNLKAEDDTSRPGRPASTQSVDPPESTSPSADNDEAHGH